jgi:hypothetical protein
MAGQRVSTVIASRYPWSFVAALAVLLLLATPSSAMADPGLGVAIPGNPIPGALGDGVKAITGVFVGGFEWTTEVAGKFIINTLGGLVDLLIPDSWARQGMSIMQWVVAVPNYAAHVGGPGGSGGYAFAGINDLRDLFVWVGIALLPLSLTYASTRAIFGLGDHVAMPVVRTLVIGVVLISYTWLWGQIAAVCNQITKAILGVPTVADGISKLFELVVGGGVLVGGLPLIGLLVMGAAGAALLALIFVKVLLILVGALVYVTGPLMIGVAPTERGEAAARAWLTLASGLFLLPVLWATVFAIAALLMNDSTGAGSIIGTNSDLGKILGSLVLALAAIAGFWLNLKLTKFAVAIMGGQVAGMLALATRGGGASTATGRSAPSNARDALSSFGNRLNGAMRGTAGPLASSGRAGAALTAVGGGAGALARGGLLGAAGGVAKRSAGAAATSSGGQALGATKAGALATRMARAGHAGWKNPSGPPVGGVVPSTSPGNKSAPNPNSPPVASAAGRPAATRQSAAASPAPTSSATRPGTPSSSARPDSSAASPARSQAPAAPRDERPPSRPSSAPPPPDRSAPRTSRGPRLPRRRKGR